MIGLAYLLGTLAGNIWHHVEIPANRVASAEPVKDAGHWQHLDSTIEDSLDFGKLCQLAILEASTDSESRSALNYIVSQLSFEQIATLLATVDYNTHHSTRETAVTLLQNRLAKLDPQQALTYALALPSGANQTALMIASFGELASRDTENALKQANELEDPTFQYLARQEILSNLGKHAPTRALTIAHELGISIPEKIRVGMIKDWVERDLDGACKALVDFETEYVWPTPVDLFDEVCKKLIASDPERVVSIWRQLLEHDYNVASRYMANDMIKAWAAIDPKAALEFAINNNAAKGHGSTESTALSSWMLSEPEAAYSWLLELEDKGLQHELITGLRPNAYKHLSPQSIISLIERIPPRQRDADSWRYAFGALQDKDYTSMMAWVNRQPDDRARSIAMWRYVEYGGALDAAKLDIAKQVFGAEPNPAFIAALAAKWAKREPDAAWAWIQQQSGTRFYPELVGRYTDQLAETDPAIAFAAVKQVASPSVRQSYTINIVRKIMRANPDQALGWIQQELQGQERDKALHTYLKFFNSTKPEHAFTALQELSEDQVSDLNYGNLLQSIGVENAIDFVRRLSSESKPVGRLIGLVAAKDPHLAMQVLNDPLITTTSVENLAELQAVIAYEWAKTDMRAAVRWTLSLPLQKGENVSLNRILPAIANRDAIYAKEVVQGLQDNSVKNAAILGMHRQLIYKNPIETFDWVEQHANETTQKVVVREVAEALLRSDSVKASAWVETLPVGPLRDSGVYEIIASLRYASPGEAFPWALSLSNREAGLRQLRSVVANWKQLAPKEARQAIRYSPDLTKAEKESLLEDFE